MNQVEFSYVIEGTEEEILNRLSPRQIADYMSYTIRDEKRTSEADLLRVGKYDTEFTLRFQEFASGYEFSQYGTDGPFRELKGTLWIESAPDISEGDASRVTINITYTIGTFFSLLLDRLARRIVKQDAEHLLQRLASDVAEGRNSAHEAAEGIE